MAESWKRYRFDDSWFHGYYLYIPGIFSEHVQHILIKVVSAANAFNAETRKPINQPWKAKQWKPTNWTANTSQDKVFLYLPPFGHNVKEELWEVKGKGVVPIPMLNYPCHPIQPPLRVRLDPEANLNSIWRRPKRAMQYVFVVDGRKWHQS